MQRRDFLKSTVAAAVAAELGIGKTQAKVTAHNWGNFDYGSGPHVTDRLNQGPFPQYPPNAVSRALTVEELAGLMKVSDKTVRRHIRAGSLPAYHIGSLVRLDPAQTAKWLRARMN